MKTNKQNSAFTLIELLVVIVIIGILSSIAIATFSNYKEKVRVTKVLAFAKQMDDVMLREISSDENKDAIGFWSFDASADTASDKFNQYPGTNLNIVDDTPNDIFSGSFAFKSGLDGYFQTSIPSTTISTITFSGLIKHDGNFGSAPYHTIAGWNGSSQVLLLPNGLLLTMTNGLMVSLSSTDYLKAARWYHVATVITPTTLKIYIDGELKATTNTTVSPVTSTTINFGGSGGSTGDLLLAEPRIYPFEFTGIEQ